MRLVHDTKDNPIVISVLGRDVAPERSKDIIARSALADDLEEDQAAFCLCERAIDAPRHSNEHSYERR